MLTFLPFTRKWPWLTSWRAWARERAKPAGRRRYRGGAPGFAAGFCRATSFARGLGVVPAELALQDAVNPAGFLFFAQLHGVVRGLAKPGAVDHVVEAALEQLQQVVAGLAGATRCLDVVVVELPLQHAVGEASLLLLLQLRAVLALLDARRGRAGRGGRGDARSRVATDEVDAETARLPVMGRCNGPSQSLLFSVADQTRRRLGGRQPLWGVGVTSWMVPTSRPIAPRSGSPSRGPNPGP